jgi:hypothetical protein
LGGRYFYELADYARIMGDLGKRLPSGRVCFVVCSNEPVNLKEFGNVAAVSGIGGVLDDVLTLAACDFVIGPPSTYSAWASFYGRVPRCEILEATQEIRLEDFAPCDEC